MAANGRPGVSLRRQPWSAGQRPCAPRPRRARPMPRSRRVHRQGEADAQEIEGTGSYPPASASASAMPSAAKISAPASGMPASITAMKTDCLTAARVRAGRRRARPRPMPRPTPLEPGASNERAHAGIDSDPPNIVCSPIRSGLRSCGRSRRAGRGAPAGGGPPRAAPREWPGRSAERNAVQHSGARQQRRPGTRPVGCVRTR